MFRSQGVLTLTHREAPGRIQTKRQIRSIELEAWVAYESKKAGMRIERRRGERGSGVQDGRGGTGGRNWNQPTKQTNK